LARSAGRRFRSFARDFRARECKLFSFFFFFAIVFALEMSAWDVGHAAAAAVEAWLGDEAAVLCWSFLTSFIASIALLLLWKLLIAPAVAANRSADDMVFLTNSVVSLYPALTAPFLALPALFELDTSDHSTALAAPPTRLALRAVGLSCGYMFYDTLYCLSHKQVRLPAALRSGTVRGPAVKPTPPF